MAEKAEKVDWPNRVAKWRVFFAGWQLGTRPKSDPECQAVSDHREGSLIMRVELNALVGLLTERGVFTAEEWFERFNSEAEYYEGLLEKRYPGVRATDHGLTFDSRAIEFMRDWRP